MKKPIERMLGQSTVPSSGKYYSMHDAQNKVGVKQSHKFFTNYRIGYDISYRISYSISIESPKDRKR
jgi:hypothetical protein